MVNFFLYTDIYLYMRVTCPSPVSQQNDPRRDPSGDQPIAEIPRHFHGGGGCRGSDQLGEEQGIKLMPTDLYYHYTIMLILSYLFIRFIDE